MIDRGENAVVVNRDASMSYTPSSTMVAVRGSPYKACYRLGMIRGAASLGKRWCGLYKLKRRSRAGGPQTRATRNALFDWYFSAVPIL